MLNKLKQLNIKDFTHTNSRKNLSGFTIIEVLIVLAIAGLIMLIVFLAVPALQRNNRNKQRASDASRTLAAANEIFVRNNWNLSQVTLGNIKSEVGSLSYYAATDLGIGTMPTLLNPYVNESTIDKLIIYKRCICSTVSGKEGKVERATKNQIAVAWTAEPSIYRCKDI